VDALYISFSKFLTTLFNKLTSNTLSVLESEEDHHYSTKDLRGLTKYGFTAPTTLFKNIKSVPSESASIVTLSKSLSIVHSSLSSINDSGWVCRDTNNLVRSDNTLLSTLRLSPKYKAFSQANTGFSLSEGEAFYLGTSRNYNFNVKNLKVSLSELRSMQKLNSFPLHFNFNINSNMLNAQQQRWLAKNSLLSESIVNNSFLITQAKKLIGSNSFNQELSTKTLWLPTKVSKLSSVESSIYFNNLRNNLFSGVMDSKYLLSNPIHHSDFSNLNFFENSRLWLVKKYFFMNSQAMNLVVTTPIRSDISSTTGQQLTDLGYSTNLYATNLNYLLNNNLTPSLNYTSVGSTNINSSDFLSRNNKQLVLVTPKLDVMYGSNNNFYFNLTSNLQQLNNNGSYFTNLDVGTTICDVNKITTNNTFYK
jgi:hypothetical protein